MGSLCEGAPVFLLYDDSGHLAEATRRASLFFLDRVPVINKINRQERLRCQTYERMYQVASTPRLSNTRTGLLPIMIQNVLRIAEFTLIWTHFCLDNGRYFNRT